MVSYRQMISAATVAEVKVEPNDADVILEKSAWEK